MVAIGRIFKGAGRLLFDPKFTEAAESALKASRKAQGWTNIHKQIGDCFIKAEKASIKANPSLWKGMKDSLTSLPKGMKTAWNGAKGLGKLKAVGGQLWKRMPLIGGILMVAFELPNIFSAFKDKGLVGGLTEIVKSGSRLVGSMAGFAIGQALIPIPIVGGLIGAIGGDWLVSKITGKSHSEKKAEMEEALTQADGAEQQAQLLQQQLGQPQLMNNPYAQNMFATNPYGQGNFNVTQATMTPQQVMAMQQMLQGGYGLPNGNYMDQDFMAMASGMNRMNYLC